MKRILNLNAIAGPVLFWMAITGLVVPGALRLVSLLMDRVGLHLPALAWLARFLMITGGVLLALFFALVVVEQIQDAILYRRYLRDRGQRVTGECPFCGNRRVQVFQRACPVCGEGLNRS